MSKRTRRTHNPCFTARVALAMIKGKKTLAELGKLFDANRYQITGWKAQFHESVAGVFGSGPAAGDIVPLPTDGRPKSTCCAF